MKKIFLLWLTACALGGIAYAGTHISTDEIKASVEKELDMEMKKEEVENQNFVSPKTILDEYNEAKSRVNTARERNAQRNAQFEQEWQEHYNKVHS